ncbi:MAG: GNAT family N-acetyltransferase [Tepidisphaeraceae bacterium]
MSNNLPMTLPTPTSTYSPIVARVPIAVRAGTMDDLPFIDRMQKQHSRELGFLPTAALEGKIKLGQVLVAEIVDGGEWMVDSEENAAPSSLSTIHYQPSTSSPVGYLIAADRYQKRDEIGYVTQINVLPEYRRHLVAAQLLQAQFDRSAYGCRLYSCWCAQDLKANEFWEAMGFTAIAFRTGSMTKGKQKSPRVHIFWQKRIRDGDTTTAWWYPSQTGGGEIREDRLVFPILPGVHWRDVLPIVLQPMVKTETASLVGATYMSPATDDSQPDASTPSTGDLYIAPTKKRTRSKKKEPAPPVPATTTVLVSPTPLGGFWFPEQGVAKEVPRPPEESPAEAVVEKPKKAKAKTKIDPRLTAMSRELRDRWGERNETIPALPAKHEVCRRIENSSTPAWRTTPLAIEEPATRALPNAA